LAEREHRSRRLNQNTEEEISRSFIDKNGVTVVRRTTGGGAVYHDLGNLNYSFITDAGDLEQLSMARFTSRYAPLSVPWASWPCLPAE
jgi:lipoate-protein ligase A